MEQWPRRLQRRIRPRRRLGWRRRAPATDPASAAAGVTTAGGAASGVGVGGLSGGGGGSRDGSVTYVSATVICFYEILEGSVICASFVCDLFFEGYVLDGSMETVCETSVICFGSVLISYVKLL